jgi:SAM-dependent methyltransferase
MESAANGMTAAFDKYSETYRETVQRSISRLGVSYDLATEAKASVIADIIAERHGKIAKLDILDVGCGVGTLHPLLRLFQRSLTGVDISGSSIAQAAQAQPWARYLAYDGARLPFADNSFDFTLTVCVLHHVPPAQHRGFLAEMRRVTRPGGTICAIEHNPLNPLTRLAVLRCPFDEDAILLGAGNAKSLFENAQLGDVAARFFLMLPFRQPAARVFERGFKALPFGAQYAVAGQVGQ